MMSVRLLHPKSGPSQIAVVRQFTLQGNLVDYLGTFAIFAGNDPRNLTNPGTEVTGFGDRFSFCTGAQGRGAGFPYVR